MKAHHITAVFAAFLVIWFLADACAHGAKSDGPKRPAWTLSDEARDDDLFCVIIPHDAAYDPDASGLHCASVGSLRIWMGHLKYAH